MTAVDVPADQRRAAPGDDWLLGVVLAVVTFWLFAQTLLNVIPGIQDSLGLGTTVANFAVSMTALMSGLFIVVVGGLADRLGAERSRALSFWSIGSWGGSGFCALFGGLMAASPLGWRSIFVISIGIALLSLFLIRSTPPSERAPASGERFDWSGLVTFVAAMLAINVFISQGPELGWFCSTCSSSSWP